MKCLLCNAFKLRKDHLKNHYVSHHGYDPKQAMPEATSTSKKSDKPVEDENTQVISFNLLLEP